MSQKFPNPYSNVMYLSPTVYNAWEIGFCSGFCGPTGRSGDLPVPTQIGKPLKGVFNEGVLAGQSAAAFGWDVVDPPCMEAREGEAAGESNAEVWITGTRSTVEMGVGFTAEVAEVGLLEISLGAAALKALTVAAVGAMIELVFTGYGEVWTTPVEKTALPAFGQRVASVLSSRGIFSCAIYMGAAADPSARGKELCVTALFRTKQQASDAAKQKGRREWAVMEWRTDQSGGFSIVDGTGW